MKRVGGRLGSNPGGIYRDDQGRTFYVKSLDAPELARNELLAARLYRLAGAPTLSYLPTTEADQVATTFVVLEKRCIAHLSEEERRAAQRWFGVHAWTANWDVAGHDGENQGVAGGVVLTLDLGGALEFRAQGDPKGRAFGPTVPELESLRTHADNPHAMRLFGDMSDEAVSEAIRLVTRIPDAEISRAVAEGGGRAALAGKLIARKADMLARLA
ncbi:hypothetical protein [Rhodobacter sp. NSM]|uniref:hypothetical protein n=1 Tax=Rhodobacter sp. NSM TaxID=3457501 RepID=UPI003FCFE009